MTSVAPPRRARMRGRSRCAAALAGTALAVLSGAAVASAAAPWSPPATLNAPDTSGFAPQVAADANGVRTAAWFGGEYLTFQLQASRYTTGGPWTPPVRVSTSNDESLGSGYSVAAGGDVTAVVWGASNVDNTQFLRASEFRNGAWSAPSLITSIPDGEYLEAPSLVVDPNGVATMVWGQAVVDEWAIMSSRNTGSGWSAPVQIAAAQTSYQNPQIDVAVDDAGVVTAAWFLGATDTSTSKPVNVSRYSGGAWSTPEVVGNADSSAYLNNVDVSVAPSGAAAVAWSRANGSPAAVVRTGSAWGAATDLGAGSPDPTSGVRLAWAGSSAIAIWGTLLVPTDCSGECSSSVSPGSYTARFSNGAWAPATKALDTSAFSAAGIAAAPNGTTVVVAGSNGSADGVYGFPVTNGVFGAAPATISTSPAIIVDDPSFVSFSAAMDATGATTTTWFTSPGIPFGTAFSSFQPAPPGPPRNVALASGATSTSRERSGGPGQAGNATIQGGTATVTWTAPRLDGLSPITGYTVNATSTDGGTSGSCSVTVTRCTITGLTPGRNYQFSVAAKNAVGSTATPTIAQGTASGRTGSLVVRATSSKKVLRSGATTRITLKATNGTASRATKARLCMAVPPAMSVAAARGATRSGRNVCFSLGTLAAGKSATKQVTLRAANRKATSVRVSATLTATGVTPAKATARTARIRLLGPVPVTG